MGYAFNICLAIPMAIIIFLLSEKLITNLTCDFQFSDRVQNSFVLSFIIGMAYIALGMTFFNEESNIYNQSLQYAMYGAGAFMVLNSVFFSWDSLNEGTKIIVLLISASGLTLYAYKNQ